MEVMRLYYVVPITGPRRALHDTKLMGYSIPKVDAARLRLRLGQNLPSS